MKRIIAAWSVVIISILLPAWTGALGIWSFNEGLTMVTLLTDFIFIVVAMVITILIMDREY